MTSFLPKSRARLTYRYEPRKTRMKADELDGDVALVEGFRRILVDREHERDRWRTEKVDRSARGSYSRVEIEVR